MDVDTKHEWVSQLIETHLLQESQSDRVLLDSVRKKEQIQKVRSKIQANIWHAHITASEHILRQRFIDRQSDGGEYSADSDYDVIKNSNTEIGVKNLSQVADLIVPTDNDSPLTCALKIRKHIGLID